MPTGYTAGVADGQITTLRDFAMLCARGMGALITMRDEPLDAPIPEKLEANPGYYGAELAKWQALASELPSLDDEECEQRAQEDYRRNMAWRTEAIERRNAERQRYETMLAEVEAWECGAEGLKQFMLDQLRESIRFDCSSDYMRDAPERALTGPEWREKMTAEAARMVARYAEEVAKEHERTAGRNAWLKALRDSLPAA